MPLSFSHSSIHVYNISNTIFILNNYYFIDISRHHLIIIPLKVLKWFQDLDKHLLQQKHQEKNLENLDLDDRDEFELNLLVPFFFKGNSGLWWNWKVDDNRWLCALCKPGYFRLNLASSELEFKSFILFIWYEEAAPDPMDEGFNIRIWWSFNWSVLLIFIILLSDVTELFPDDGDVGTDDKEDEGCCCLLWANSASR